MPTFRTFSFPFHHHNLFLAPYSPTTLKVFCFHLAEPYCNPTIRLGQMSSPGMQVTRERNVHTLSFSVSERWREKWRLLREKKYSSKFQMSWREELPFVTESFKRKGRAFCKNLHHRFFLQARGWHIRTSQTP